MKKQKITTENIVRLFEKNRDVSDFDPDDIDWNYLCIHEILTENFIKKYKKYIDDDVDWYYICKNQKLSEKFMEAHIGYICWSTISSYQKLSEKFIEKYINRLTLADICAYQKLSKNFLIKYVDKLERYTLNLLRGQKYLPEQYINKITRFEIERIPNYHKAKNLCDYGIRLEQIVSYNTLYWSLDQKCEMVKNSPYKILKDEKGEYIIAWKAIRKDRYSLFNFQYKYEKGKTYNTHCDHNLNEENSFGFGAWTFKQAKIYGQDYTVPSKIIKVKIYIKDVGVILPDNDWKIRAKRLTVLT